MAEALPRSPKLLRIAWILPVVLLLCALQFGWLDRLGVTTGNGSGSGDSFGGSLPSALVTFGRRDLATGGADVQSGRTATRRPGGDAILSWLRRRTLRCDGPLDVPKVRAHMRIRGCRERLSRHNHQALEKGMGLQTKRAPGLVYVVVR